MTGLVFVLLVVTIFVHLWFAGVPLLLGGPNVILGGLAVLLSLAWVLRRAGRIEERSRIISTLVMDFRPVIPIIAVSLLLTAWALTVYLFTDTLKPARLAQMALGVGILFAVYLSVNSVYRATVVALAVIAATLVSMLFGIAVAYVGEPFLSMWLDVAVVDDVSLRTVLTEGRISGLAPTTITLSYQIAAAVPLAFAALLYNPLGQGKKSGRTYSAALYVLLMTMVTVMVLNGTRSTIHGVLVAAVIVALPSMRMPRIRRRLRLVVPLIVVWLTAFFNPVFNVEDLVSGVGGLIIADRTAVSGGPTIDGLSAGVVGFSNTGDGPVIGHTFKYLTPSRLYAAQMRAWNADGFGAKSEDVAVRADMDGSFVLTWREPAASAGVLGYQFRLRDERETEWLPWLDLSEVATGDERKIRAYMAFYEFNREVSASGRIFNFASLTGRTRIPITSAALRYSVDYPLGTGVYSPDASHLSEGLDPWMANHVLENTPHNQFLVILVYYGFPGMILLILFYVFVLRSSLRSGRIILRSRDASLYLLGAGVVGGLAAYGVNSLLHNAGPFVGDWYHFFAVGLVFSIQRIAVLREANGGETQP